MGDVLWLILASVIGGALGAWAYARVRLRRAARAFEGGRPTTFAGFVLGSRPYCRAAGGLLVVEGDALSHVVDRGMPGTRRDIPVSQLTVVRARPATRADDRDMPPGWTVLECRDGDEQVLIACDRREMRFVQHAFLRALDASPRD
ncbi:hypothetical protein ACTHAM_001864 [Cellulomonas soli]|uniref:hypothetical protein n=1 Tax=Cellulomonas soli TaxID=931535 RepID=UPI003F834923